MARKSIVKDVDKGWRNIVEELTLFSKSDVFVGLNEGNFPVRLQEDQALGKIGLSTAAIGAVHEFGSADGRIPPRPWLRSGIDAARAEISKKIGEGYDEIVKQTRPAKQVLNRLGLLGVNIVRTYMRVKGPSVWLPLSPLTIAAKKSTGILKDTGQMIGSITYVIKRASKVIGKSKPRPPKRRGARNSQRVRVSGRRTRGNR